MDSQKKMVSINPFDFSFLLLPEDSQAPGMERKPVDCSAGIQAAKTIVWLLLSVIVALVLGQLS